MSKTMEFLKNEDRVYMTSVLKRQQREVLVIVSIKCS